MAIQRTLSIIKPDAVKRNQVAPIQAILSNAGLTAIHAKSHHLSREEAERFYAEHHGKSFFEECITFMTSGPIYIQVLEGENAISTYRDLMGATNPEQAKPNTLRAEFGGKTLPQNAVHGSDSPESAALEIDFFF